MVAVILSFWTDKTVSGEQLDLLTRFGRQLAEGGDSSASSGGGGITLGLVGALQKWANSLETQTAAILAEVGDLKAAKASLAAEVAEVRLQNMNLANDIQSANERSINLKEAYTRSKDELAAVRAEMAGLRATVESHAAQLGQQAAAMTATEQLVAEQASQLSGMTDQLTGLQGKQEGFQVEVTALQANLTGTLHDLALALDETKENTMASLTMLGSQLESLESRQAEEAESFRAEVRNASSVLEGKLAGLNSQVQRDLTGSLQERIYFGHSLHTNNIVKAFFSLYVVDSLHTILEHLKG
jgi:chromosome segregation ATPase